MTLLPCPFCGSNVVKYDAMEDGREWVICCGCGADIDSVNGDSSEDDVVTKWNRRATSTSNPSREVQP